jgi:hypothetical protein
MPFGLWGEWLGAVGIHAIASLVTAPAGRCTCDVRVTEGEVNSQLLDILKGQLDRCGPDRLVCPPCVQLGHTETSYALIALVGLIGLLTGFILGRFGPDWSGRADAKPDASPRRLGEGDTPSDDRSPPSPVLAKGPGHLISGFPSYAVTPKLLAELRDGSPDA